MTGADGSREVVNDTRWLGDQFQPEVRRARYQRLTIYEVEESELRLLEHGAPDSVLLSLAVALFTLAATFAVTLLTATFESSTVHTAVVACTVVGYVTGGILTGLWLRTRSSVSRCVRVIRDRLPPDWVLEADSGNQDNGPEA